MGEKTLQRRARQAAIRMVAEMLRTDHNMYMVIENVSCVNGVRDDEALVSNVSKDIARVAGAGRTGFRAAWRQLQADCMDGAEDDDVIAGWTSYLVLVDQYAREVLDGRGDADG